MGSAFFEWKVKQKPTGIPKSELPCKETGYHTKKLCYHIKKQNQVASKEIELPQRKWVIVKKLSYHEKAKLPWKS